MHAIGIVSPIAASALVQRGILFSRFYAILIGLRCISLALVGWAFRNLEREAPQAQTIELISTAERTAREQMQAQAQSQQPPVQKQNSLQELRRALSNRVTLLGALFIFAYQGAEVSISGWVISFLLDYRGSSPDKVGYVTAYFWVSSRVLQIYYQMQMS